ncbi:MAG TPA: UDP-N-acetylmuramate dehydrogenase [Patescibacteria group bacterium]|nr:UDP-N-acetylmuramate dehydrogenase [Patescibacteria group bacterium]
MKIFRNYPLKNNNTFKIDVKAKYFAEITSSEDISKILTDKKINQNILVLGSGSNILFQKDYPGLLMHIATKGIKILEENEKTVMVEVEAGESWNGFVHWSINNGLSGNENLVLIPGTVGAAVVQNIAAYGQNFEDIFHSLQAVEISSGKTIEFDKIACKFRYRDSYFKKEAKGKFIVTKVRINLSKNEKIDTSYHSRYESLEEELKKFANPPYNIRDISKAVTIIRERKFPDWEKVGTVGSFFLNPIISKKHLEEIQKKVPSIQFYPIDKLSYPQPDDPKFKYSDYVKVAAGWLLEELGWKGKWIDKIGTSQNQSLVIITQKGATPADIISFSEKMKSDVKKEYGIDLEPEVNII